MSEFGPDIQTVKLEKLKLAVTEAISPHLIDAQVDYSQLSFFMSDEILLRVKGFIWAETLESETFSWPADWWEAFKDRWFPQWALKRWPVKYERRKVDIKATYPEYRPNIPNQKCVLQVLKDWNYRMP